MVGVLVVGVGAIVYKGRKFEADSKVAVVGQAGLVLKERYAVIIEPLNKCFFVRTPRLKNLISFVLSCSTAISSNAPFSSGDNSIIDSCTASRPTKLRQRSNRKESNTMNELFDKARCKCYYESMDGLGKARKYLVRKLNTKM